MKPSSIKAIGRRFENWVNEEIEKAGLGPAIRTPGSGSGKIKGDSFNLLGLTIECKSQRNPTWKGNIEQAKRQAGDPSWILVQRDPSTPQAHPSAFALLEFEHLLLLLEKARE